MKEASHEPSLLQATRRNDKHAAPLVEDIELIVRDPAAAPADHDDSELLAPHAWQMVFMELNATAAQEESKHSCMTVVLEILMRASELDLADGRHQHKPVDVVKDLKAALAAGKDPWKVLQDDHPAMLTSIEEFAASTEADSLDSSMVLTSDCLNMINGRNDTAEFSNASNIVEGDMLAPNADEAKLIQAMAGQGARFSPNLWSNPGRIPYCFSNTLAASARQAVKDAVAHYKEMVPCIGFVEIGVADESGEWCTEKPAIFITGRQSGCFASLGANNPDWYSTTCNLQANGCDTMGIAVHEIGHNLGMFHEQSRSDYAKYIKILWDNIQPNRRSQYDMSVNADTSVPYDYMSVMHYSDTSFGITKNGVKQKTMEKLTPSSRKMGNRMGLTHADAVQVAKMYGCAAPQDFKLCEGTSGCTKGACICHQNPAKKEIIKTTSSDGCNRCESKCPTYPSGTPSECGCASGYEKGSFSSGGGTYYYCKSSSSSSPRRRSSSPRPSPRSSSPRPPPPPSSPRPSPPPRSPRPSPPPSCPNYPSGTSNQRCMCGSGSTKVHFRSGGRYYYSCKAAHRSETSACRDSKSFCGSYKAYCVGYKFTGLGPVNQVCKKTCDNCD